MNIFGLLTIFIVAMGLRARGSTPSYTTSPPSTVTPLTTPTVHPEMPGYCPDGWTAYHDGCYKVFAEYTDRKSWPEAQFTCSQLSGSLASIHTRQEMEIIRGLMVGGSVDIWSGLTRRDSGSFVWSDDTPVDYTNWNVGEPSYEIQPGYEDCVEIYLSTGKWNDVDCLREQGYVCERPEIRGEEPIADHKFVDAEEPIADQSTALTTGYKVTIGVFGALIICTCEVLTCCLHCCKRR